MNEQMNDCMYEFSCRPAIAALEGQTDGVGKTVSRCHA